MVPGRGPLPPPVLVRVAGGENALPDEVIERMKGGPYGLDKPEVLANTYSCWVDNDGKAGEPDFGAGPKAGQLPDCFFGAVVLKGKQIGAAGVTHGQPGIEIEGWVGQDGGGAWCGEDVGVMKDKSPI